MTHKLVGAFKLSRCQVSGSCPRVMVDNCWGYLSDAKSWDGWDLWVKNILLMVQKSGEKATWMEKTPVNYGTTGAGFFHQQYVVF